MSPMQMLKTALYALSNSGAAWRLSMPPSEDGLTGVPPATGGPGGVVGDGVGGVHAVVFADASGWLNLTANMTPAAAHMVCYSKGWAVCMCVCGQE